MGWHHKAPVPTQLWAAFKTQHGAVTPTQTPPLSSPGINHRWWPADPPLVSLSPGGARSRACAPLRAGALSGLPWDGCWKWSPVSLCHWHETVPVSAPPPGPLSQFLKCWKLIRPEVRHYNSTVQTLKTPSPLKRQKSIINWTMV